MLNRPLSKRLAVADGETLREIMREAEAYLNAQWAAAIAADQRAYTFAGFCSAAAAVLVGGAYGLVARTNADLPMAVLAAVVAGLLLRAAWMAASSAGPVDFEYVGNQPGYWIDDVEAGKALHDALAEQCQHYEEMIEANTETIKANAAAFKEAYRAAFLGIGIGAVGFGLWLTVTILIEVTGG